MVIGGIVAGGIGSRMGQNIKPKQFLDLAGKPVVVHTIEKFLASPEIDKVVVGVHKEWIHLMNDLVEKYFDGNDSIAIVAGGSNRNETIYNIINCAKEKFNAPADTIMVTHDAVRPFLSLRIIEDNVAAAREYGVCDTVISASDTIIQSENGEYITDVPIRKQMYQGQTPQSFSIELFEKVYGSMTEEELQIVTDACKMFFLRGYNVHLVEGEVNNFKITYPFDLKMAMTLMGDESK
ncbi:MAG: 2-C-methyl-D-erythritol 4-phosphate cytidylyltransferase [Lachnospiraceae bacterium]|nr:2-C-methyl-D-erythritol 4-phosphate cytidylyltransferase [Lachnospiraceae bacterium]